MKRIFAVIGIAWCFVMVSLSHLSAQKGGGDRLDDSFYPYLQDDEDMKALPAKKSFAVKGVQYGGWLTPVFIDDSRESLKLISSVTTLRLWFKSYLWDNSYLYLRGKDTFTRVMKKEGYSGVESTENVPDIDLAFIAMSSEDQSVKFSLGRKYFLMGSGIILNGRGDGAELGVYSRYVNMELAGLYTGLLRKYDDPYRLSSRDNSDGSKRVMAGGTIFFQFYNQTLSFMGMAQVDMGEEESGVKSRYNSQYSGAGLKGVVAKSLSYEGEFIYETGKSYTDTGDKKNINAYAGVFNLNYYIDADFKPVLIAQYAYGSGDANKLNYGSPTGNTRGNDTGFLSFGTYVGGYALRPLLSNIHVLRGGFSIAPLAGSEKYYLKRMNIIAKYSYYMKDKESAPINYGSDATEKDPFVGQGVDLSFRWAVLSDYSLFVNYASFFPGKAYASGDDGIRNFFMLGMNFSF